MLCDVNLGVLDRLSVPITCVGREEPVDEPDMHRRPSRQGSPARRTLVFGHELEFDESAKGGREIDLEPLPVAPVFLQMLVKGSFRRAFIPNMHGQQ
jgi:hypothetical protein